MLCTRPPRCQRPAVLHVASNPSRGFLTRRSIDQRGAYRMTAVRGHRQIAALLVQERVEPPVVRRRQIEHAKQGAIAAVGLAQAEIDQIGEVGPRELPRLESLINALPKVFSRAHPLPETDRG